MRKTREHCSVWPLWQAGQLSRFWRVQHDDLQDSHQAWRPSQHPRPCGLREPQRRACCCGRPVQTLMHWLQQPSCAQACPWMQPRTLPSMRRPQMHSTRALTWQTFRYLPLLRPPAPPCWRSPDSPKHWGLIVN